MDFKNMVLLAAITGMLLFGCLQQAGKTTPQADKNVQANSNAVEDENEQPPAPPSEEEEGAKAAGEESLPALP